MTVPELYVTTEFPSPEIPVCWDMITPPETLKFEDERAITKSSPGAIEVTDTRSLILESAIGQFARTLKPWKLASLLEVPALTFIKMAWETAPTTVPGGKISDITKAAEYRFLQITVADGDSIVTSAAASLEHWQDVTV